MDDQSLTAWLAAARAAHFAACLLIGATWAFDRLVADGDRTWRRVGGGLLCLATPLALVSGLAWLAIVAAEMAGVPVREAVRPAVLGTVWSRTQFGRAWQVHAACWAAGPVAAAVWARTGRGGWAGLAAAAGLVAGLAWAGHGATGPAPAWHRAADVSHLLASAVWPAGLVPFALWLGTTARSPDPTRWAGVAAITGRLSSVSLAAVSILTVTGAFDAWCLVGSADGLVATRYGRLLLVKIALFAGMVGVGAVNRLVWKPRLMAGPGPARWLLACVWVEVAAGGVVLGIVGLLGLLEPARQ